MEKKTGSRFGRRDYLKIPRYKSPRYSHNNPMLTVKPEAIAGLEECNGVTTVHFGQACRFESELTAAEIMEMMSPEFDKETGVIFSPPETGAESAN